MANLPDERPIIIKKKKIIAGGGHHGGAWKVAYADFVTAMMAFFMLMWLLNATTEQQRMGLADYFSPTVPISRVSGGGDGAFGGENVFSEETIAQEGTGAADRRPTEGRQSNGMLGSDYLEEQENADDAMMDAIGRALAEAGGDSYVTELVLRHVQTRLTDEGLIIEIFSLPDAPLFDAGGEPVFWLPDFAAVLSDLFSTVTNQVAIDAHVATEPLVRQSADRIDLSTRRSALMRRLLEAGGLSPRRIERVTGYGNNRPVTSDPLAARNDRVEVILLRDRL
ncbi:chemotaxis protein MotB [Rhodobacterales bacterium HKCCE2091]|nr:chemotaxis protein MotB [Rhodobacterales bacterium HKCCE2091]